MLKKIISNNSGMARESGKEQDSNNKDGSSVSRTFDTPIIKPNQDSSQTFNSSSMSSSKNILSNDTKIKGTIEFSNDLILDGNIEGEVKSLGQGNLIVGENANINGEIKTKSVIVHGTIKGNLTIDDRCELKSSAKLEGDIKANSLSIEEGAQFVGNSSVGSMSTTPKSSRPVHLSSSAKKN